MHQQRSVIENPWIWLTAIIGVFLLTRLYLFVGIVGSDDVSLATHSLELLQDGLYLPHDHYSARIGIIYPQALIFALFGVGEWQMAALPLLASLTGLVVAYKLGEHYAGQSVGLLAALMIALFPLDAYFSSQLMPDLLLGATLGLSFYLMVRAEANDSRALAILAGLVWGWAYLVKVEAFFLLFVVITLWAMRQLSWRTVFTVGLSVGAVVLTEHIVYFINSGDPMLRLHLALTQGGGKMVANSGLAANELWVFPKAWFMTPYYFGLHYYALFAATLWLLVRRQWVYLGLVVWVIVYLFWLQFGGNPFRDDYKVKTHLPRYCNMLNVPMALVIALMLQDIAQTFGKRIFALVLAPMVALPLLFAPFNQLNAERQIATKHLLDTARDEQLFPLYMDRTSLTVAALYLYDEMQDGKLKTLQKHDFKKMHTEVPAAEDIDGHILINRGFVEYGKRRYGVTAVTQDEFAQHFDVHTVADNPLPGLAYLSANTLRTAAGLIPIQFFREKIQNTADALLEGDDAVLMKKK